MLNIDNSVLVLKMDYLTHGRIQIESISSYENQSHWDWFVNDDNMGTNYITYQFRTMGCGGGTIASSYRIDFMGYAYDDEDMFHLEEGDYQMILGWAAHECRCDWPCNGVPDAPFTQ